MFLHVFEASLFTWVVSGPQVSEPVPGLRCIQSDRRQDATLARPQPNAREAAAQRRRKHQPQEATGQTVQLVSARQLPSALEPSHTAPCT